MRLADYEANYKSIMEHMADGPRRDRFLWLLANRMEHEYRFRYYSDAWQRKYKAAYILCSKILSSRYGWRKREERSDEQAVI